jgi:Ice-binding-like
MKKGVEMLHRTEIRNRMISSSLVASMGFAALLCWASPSLAVTLGTAGNFGALAGSTVTSTTTAGTAINGFVGVSPGTSITGFPPGTYTGILHPGDGTAATAQSDLTTAYNFVKGQTCTSDLTGQDLGGLTLTPGVYCFPSTSAQLTGTLTLNFQSDPSAVFIFQIGTTLGTAASSSVSLINVGGGSNCNVFWQVGSTATLGASNMFVGNILAQTSIHLGTFTNLSGRALARDAAVTLDQNPVAPCTVTALPVELQRLEAE